MSDTDPLPRIERAAAHSAEPGKQSNAPAPASPEPAPSDRAAKARFRTRLIALGGVIAGMVIGAIVEMFVQGAMESTGWFGPTLDAVMDEQMANFRAIQEKLDALGGSTDEAERLRLREELAVLLRRQEQLTDTTHSELRDYQRQVDSLRSDALKSTGSAAGADVWLAEKESLSIGSRENVFSLLDVDGNRVARVNVSGKTRDLKAGDFVEVPVGDAVWKVFYKQGSRGDDQTRVGFDIVQPEA